MSATPHQPVHAARERRLARTLLATAGLAVCMPAFASEPEIAYLAWSEGFWQAWVMRDNGEGARQVTRSDTDKTRVSWFPDGKRLLVSAQDGKVREVEIASGTESPVALEQSPVMDATVSPDGKQMTYSFGIGLDGNDIWIANVDGSGVRKLVKQAALQHDPAWSADGMHIYFLSGDGGQAHDIWRVSVANQSTEQLTAGRLYHFDVTVSGRGELAYSSNKDGNYELYRAAPGRPAERVTEHPALDARPSFSPEGGEFVFESTRSGLPQVWRIDLDTKKVRQLTKHGKGARAPVWKSGTGAAR